MLTLAFVVLIFIGIVAYFGIETLNWKKAIIYGLFYLALVGVAYFLNGGVSFIVDKFVNSVVDILF